jgi:hypothetical protein
MMKVQQTVGRLVEVRIASPVVLEDFPGLIAGLQQAMAPHPKVVFCVDWREATVFTPEVSARFLEIMKNDNPKIERSAFLIGKKAIFGMQLERLIASAGSPNRKTFRESFDLGVWLAHVLTPLERVRLVQFMGEYTPPA